MRCDGTQLDAIEFVEEIALLMKMRMAFVTTKTIAWMNQNGTCDDQETFDTARLDDDGTSIVRTLSYGDFDRWDL